MLCRAPERENGSRRVWKGRTAGPLAACVAALALCMVAGCPAPFARLDNVIVGDRPAEGAELGGVHVRRGGHDVSVVPGMALFAADDICTDAASTAAITFVSGTQVILEPDTCIRVLNPGILAFFGKLFVKVRGLFSVEARDAVVIPDGTWFAVSVGRNGKVRVVVLDGRVKLRPKGAEWSAVPLNADRVAEIDPGGQPNTLRPMPGEINAIKQRTSLIEGIVRRGPLGLVRQVAVPPLIGANVEAAKDALARAGLRPGRLSYTEAGRGDVGTVVGQDPKAGTLVPTGSTVNLLVRGIR